MKSVPLGELCEIQIGRTPSRSVSEFWGKGYPWVSISDMQSEVVTKTREQITHEAVESLRCKLVPKGTLLLSFKLSVGKLAFAGVDLFTNEAIAALAIKDSQKISGKYLYFVLRIIKYVGGNQAAKGITLNSKSLAALPIPLPPLSDQIRIADMLSRAEKLIAQRKESLALLDELVKSRFVEMFGDPVRNEKGWEVSALGALYGKDSIVDGPFGSAINVRSDYLPDGEIPIIRTVNIRRFDFNFADLKFIRREKYEMIRRSNVKPGDILISKVGTIGNVCIFPPAYPEAVLSTTGSTRIRNNNSKINSIFLLFYLDFYKPLLLKMASTGVQPFLNLSHIKGIQVIVPPLPLQNAFAAFVEKIEALKRHHQQSLGELENLYGSLSQRAFAGELTRASKENNEGSGQISQEDQAQKKPISEMTLDEYYGVPEEITAEHGYLDRNQVDYEFLMKKYFAKRPIDAQTFEDLFNREYYDAGHSFDYEEFRKILIENLEHPNGFLMQIYNIQEKRIEIRLK